MISTTGGPNVGMGKPRHLSEYLRIYQNRQGLKRQENGLSDCATRFSNTGGLEYHASTLVYQNIE